MNALSLLQSVNADWNADALRAEEGNVLRQRLQRQADQRWKERTSPLHLCGLFPSLALHGGMRCSEAAFPAMYRLGALARRILRLQQPVGLTLLHSDQIAAVPLPSGDENEIRVLLTSAAVDRLWVKETLFLIGRAIGKAIGPAPLVCDPAFGLGPADESERLLRSLWRREELDADRFGLLCCQDADVAQRALAKSATGAGDDFLPESVKGFETPVDSLDIAVETLAADEFLSVRLSELRRFYGSEDYRSVFDGAQTTGRTAAISRDADVPDPSYHETAPPAQKGSEQPPESGTKEPAPTAVPFASPDSFADPLDEAVREFNLCACLWVLSLKDELTPGESELLLDLYGDEAVQLWRLRIETEGEAVLWRTCQNRAKEIAESLDVDFRLGMIREILSVAMAESFLSPRENDLIVELADGIGLDEDDLSILAAEHVDPEFAMYQFELGQPVEVQWDGQWVRGTVEEVSSTGDLRVRFDEEDEVFQLNPVADLVRPVFQRQAG